LIIINLKKLIIQLLKLLCFLKCFVNSVISSVKKVINSGDLVKNSMILILFFTETILPAFKVLIVLLHIELKSIKAEFLIFQSSLENPLIADLNPLQMNSSILNCSLEV